MTEASQPRADSQESRDSEKPNGPETSGQTHMPQHPVAGRRRRWGRIVAIGAILLLGPALWFGIAPLIGVYTVEVTYVASKDKLFAQQITGGTEVQVLLHNPLGHDTAYAEVFLERFVDDCGKDLLIRNVPLVSSDPRCEPYEYHIGFDRFVSTAGVSPMTGGFGSSTKFEFSIYSPVAATEGAKAATVAGRVVVKTGGRLWKRQIVLPFEATLPISRDRFLYVSYHVVTPVPDSAWGPRGAGRSEDMFVLSAMTRTPGRPNRDLAADFRILSLDPRTLVSYAVTLTGCYDDKGKKLLGDQPARTGISERWSVSGNGQWTTPDQRVMPVFSVTTNRMPSPAAVSVTYEGMIRLKLGDGEEEVVLKDVRLDPEKPFRIGPVELSAGKHPFEIIEVFVARGDQGMLRHLVVESDGRAFSKTFDPTPFWSHASWVDLVVSYGTGTVTINAKYLTKQWHYDLPFKITVPLSASSWTVMKPGLPSSRSRPAGK